MIFRTLCSLCLFTLPIYGSVDIVLGGQVGQGTVEGLPVESSVEAGTVLNITAVPDTGWEFEHWDEDINAVDSTVSITIQEVPDSIVVAPIFYRPILGAPFGARMYEWDWEYDEIDGAHVFSNTSGDNSNTLGLLLGFALVGPGVFSFEAEDSNVQNRLDLIGADFGSNVFTFSDGRASVEVPEGKHTVVFRDTLNDSSEVRGVEWEPGYLVTFEIYGNGSILGADESGSMRVVPTVNLNLEGVPETGYEFVQWLGYGDESNLNLEINEPVEIIAIFNRLEEVNEILGDPIFKSTSGNGVWTLDDGIWSPPDGLHKYAKSRIEGVATGPARLRVIFEDSSNVDAVLNMGLDGVVVSRSYSGSSPEFNVLEIPVGEHSFYVETDWSNGMKDYDKPIQLILEYPVSIESIGGDVAVSQLTEEDFIERDLYSKRDGWVEHGATLTLEATPFENSLNLFRSWSGNIESELESVSIVVEGPIVATARFGKELTIDEGQPPFVISPPENLLEPKFSANRLTLFPELGVTTLIGAVEGPGVLVLEFGSADEASVFVDNEEVFPEFLGNIVTEIGIGIHDVKIDLSLLNEDRLPLVEDGFSYPRILLFYEKGYRLPLTATLGGRINILSKPDVLLDGGIVEIEAEANFGYEFVGWDAPYAERERTFSFTFDPDQEIIKANFQVLDLFNGYTWSFEGIAPRFLDVSSQRPRGTVSLRTDEENLVSRASTTIEGPGMLDIYMDREANSSSSRMVIVNGIEYSLPSRGDYSIPLDSGSNTVVYESRYNAESSFTGLTYFGWPELRETYHVSATSNWAEPLVELPEGGLVYGAVVSISTDALVGESVFSGWRNLDTNEIVSFDPEYEYTIGSDLALEALYSTVGVEVSGFVTFAGSEGWISEKSDEANEFDDRLVAQAPYVPINFQAVEPARLVFEYEPKEGESLSVTRNFQHVASSGELLLGKEVYTVFIDVGDVLMLQFNQLVNGDSPRISILGSKPGWGPTVVIRGEGAVEFEEDGEKLYPIVPEVFRDHFAGWGRLLEGTIPPLEMGSLQTVEGNFAYSSPTLIGVESFTSSGIQTNDLGEWSLISSQSGKVTFEVEGPVVLSFGENSDVEVFVNGEEIDPANVWHLVELIPEGSQFLYTLNSGIQNVEIQLPRGRTANSAKIIEGLLVYPEYLNNNNISVTVSPENLIFPIGSSITVEATHENEFFSFFEWNEPYAEYGSSFEFVPENHGTLVPVFLRPENFPGDIELVGGGVLVVPWPDFHYQKLDGVFIPELENAIETSNHMVIPLGDESHMLSLTEPQLHGEYFHDLNGVQGLVVGQGVVVQESRNERIYYSKGEEVRLQVSGAQIGLVNWTGLPNDAVFDESSNSVRFVVSDDFFVVGSRTQLIVINGISVELAGGGFVDQSGSTTSIENIRAPFRSVLRVSAPISGWLNYNLTQPLRIYKNGQEYEASEKGRMFVSEGDSVEFDYRVLENPIRYTEYAQQIRVYEFSFEEVAIGNSEYLDWWNSFTPSVSRQIRLFELDADFDGDGLSILREFELGTDPWRVEDWIWIEASDEGSGDLVLSRFLPSAASELEVIYEWSISPVGPWEDLSSLLEDDSLNPGETRSVYLSTQTDELELGRIFFRVSSSGDSSSRTIGSLLGLGL